jgi:GT2 family glycosyltransferase
VEIAKRYAVVIVTDRKSIAFNRQIGAEESSGDIIVTTDADCVFPKNWLESMCRHFEDGSVVCVSGPTVPIPGESNFLDRLCYQIGNLFLRLKNLTNKPWFRGSNMAYRKGAFGEIGGYNIKKKAREDSELSKKLALVGKTIFDPDAVVMTSMRRRRKMGWLDAIRYYLDTPIALITGREYYRKAE